MLSKWTNAIWSQKLVDHNKQFQLCLLYSASICKNADINIYKLICFAKLSATLESKLIHTSIWALIIWRTWRDMRWLVMEAGEVVPRSPLIATKKLVLIVSQTGNAFHIIPTETDKFSRLIIILWINFKSILMFNTTISKIKRCTTLNTI